MSNITKEFQDICGELFPARLLGTVTWQDWDISFITYEPLIPREIPSPIVHISQEEALRFLGEKL